MYVYIFIHKIPVSHYRIPVSERRGFERKSRCLKIGVLLKMQWNFRKKKALIIFPFRYTHSHLKGICTLQGSF